MQLSEANGVTRGRARSLTYLPGKAHVVIRAQGGDNAGHTVVDPQGKFALHLVPHRHLQSVDPLCHRAWSRTQPHRARRRA